MCHILPEVDGQPPQPNRQGSRTGLVVLPNTFAATVTVALSSAAHSNAITSMPSGGDEDAGSEVR